MKEYILKTEEIVKLFSDSIAELAMNISAKTEARNTLNTEVDSLRLQKSVLESSIIDLTSKTENEKVKAQEELAVIKSDIVVAIKTLETTIASTVAISNDRNKASETVRSMLVDIEGIKKTIAPYFDSAKDILEQTELAGKEIIKLNHTLSTEVANSLSTIALREANASKREENVTASEERLGKLLIAVK